MMTCRLGPSWGCGLALALVRDLPEHRALGESGCAGPLTLDGCDRGQGGAGQRQVRPVPQIAVPQPPGVEQLDAAKSSLAQQVRRFIARIGSHDRLPGGRDHRRSGVAHGVTQRVERAGVQQEADDERGPGESRGGRPQGSRGRPRAAGTW